MKRIDGLYERLVSLENLKLADENARKGKLQSYGVLTHDKNKEANLISLHHQLKNKTFKNSPYEMFNIYVPKERVIYRLPYFPDRIVHHATMNILEPIWMKIFTKDTYSCIKNRGIHAGAKSLKEALREDKKGTTYCLKMDIKKFYPSINHDILKIIIRKKIKDKDVLWLLDEIIDSAEGVPIGNYLSQYFANLYLAYFDHWIKEEKKIKYYWRYADDMVVLSTNKDELHNLLMEIKEYMSSKLNLVIKENYQVFPVEKRGIDFLGYVFFHDHTILRKGIKINFKKKMYLMNKRKKKPSKMEYKKAIASWYGWCKHCDSRHLLQTIFKTINYEIK